MTTEEFETIVATRCTRVQETLCAKASEYARGDRLSNFKKIAVFRNIEPEEALMGLVMKHIAALDDFIQDLPGVTQDASRWDEKIGDIIAYMILLDALVQERLQ